MLDIARLICEREWSPAQTHAFGVAKIVLMCVLVVLAIAMMVFVVMQKSDTNGVSAISGQSDTFYNRNKGATLQGKIKILTIIDAVLIMVLCIVFLILNTLYSGAI